MFLLGNVLFETQAAPGQKENGVEENFYQFRPLKDKKDFYPFNNSSSFLVCSFSRLYKDAQVSLPELAVNQLLSSNHG